MTDDSNPVSFWLFGFPALVVLGVVTALVACAGVVGASPEMRSYTVLGMVWVLTSIYFAAILGKADDLADLVLGSLVVLGFLAAAGMPILLAGPASLIATWIFYGVVVLVSLTVALDEAGRPQTVTRSLMFLWVVLLTMIGLAEIPLFAHPVPPLPEGIWSVVLDVRLVLGIALGLILVGKAITRVARLPAPRIPGLPEIGMEPLAGDSKSIVLAILRPLSVVVVVSLTVLRTIVNFLWELFAAAAVALARFVREVSVLATDILLNRKDLPAIVRLVTGFLGLILVVHLSRALSASTLTYLRNEPAPPLEILAVEMNLAVFILCYAVLVLFITQIVDWKVTALRTAPAAAAFAGTAIAVAVTVSSVITHFAGRWTVLRMAGFERLGPFTGIMLGVCSIMFVYMIARQLIVSRWLATARSRPVPGP